MPHISVNLILEKDLPSGGSVTLPYPPGKNEASFFGAFGHNLVVDDVFYKSPIDFVVVPKPEHLELHWQHERVLRSGNILYMRLEELGTTYYYDQKNNVTVQNMVASSLFMVNLRAPREKDREHYVKLCRVESEGVLPQENKAPDVPRNVTVVSTANDTHRAFCIDGFDCYDRPMTEIVTGPNAGIRQGRKAFAKVARISVDGPCNGDIAVGFGNRLGLPVYLPAEGYVIQEMVAGKQPPRGMIITGETGTPTATSGDRRGTYSPSPSVELNGRNAIYLLLSLPNPGNIGSPDYARK